VFLSADVWKAMLEIMGHAYLLLNVVSINGANPLIFFKITCMFREQLVDLVVSSGVQFNNTLTVKTN
jgi:hypothetical protein